MHNDTVYGGWESSHTGLTSRSYLYALPPIGVGTAAVESLTGYISRTCSSSRRRNRRSGQLRVIAANSVYERCPGGTNSHEVPQVFVLLRRAHSEWRRR